MRLLNLSLAVLLASCGVEPGELPEAAQARSPVCTNILCGGDPVPTFGACQLVTGTLTASTTSPRFNALVTFTWTTSSHSCSTALTLDGQVVPRNGSLTLKAKKGLYTLMLGSRALASVPLTLTLASPVRITANTVDERDLFVHATSVPNTTVLIQDGVDLDLSNRPTIYVAAGVTIASERRLPGTNPLQPAPGIGPIARDSNHLGPRIFSTSHVADELLLLNSDNVTIRGLRIQGPNPDPSPNTGVGIFVRCAKGIELDNLEVSGWGSDGIAVSREADLCPGSPDISDVYIHDCFLHHNQHAPGGLGYGVSVGDGAHAFIEHNVFDYNRHAIASDGMPGSQYVAYENLVLKGGGYHEAVVELPGVPWSISVSWETHAFDVHGTKDCINGVEVPVGGADDACGPAGAYFEFGRNAFQYERDEAIRVRGTPRYGWYVYDNVFAHASEGDAVSWAEVAPIKSGNVANIDTFGEYGVCDFDGDGLEDLFLATGRSWWFASAGRMHWTFLSSKDDRLGQLGLGDFDHDGKCDVFRSSPSAGWQISRGGRSAWTTMPGANYFPFSELAFADFSGDGFTDVFRRAPDGQWWAYYNPATTGAPTALNSSALPLSDLRFGDFDADGITDIVGSWGGVWRWSKSGTGPWNPTPLNANYTSLSGVFVANLDGLPGDDLVRITREGPYDSYGNPGITRIEISSNGRGTFTTFAVSVHERNSATSPFAYLPPYVFTGRFATAARDSVLSIGGWTRRPSQFTAGQSGFLQHGFYAY